jgi:hypothetical protein
MKHHAVTRSTCSIKACAFILHSLVKSSCMSHVDFMLFCIFHFKMRREGGLITHSNFDAMFFWWDGVGPCIAVAPLHLPTRFLFQIQLRPGCNCHVSSVFAVASLLQWFTLFGFCHLITRMSGSSSDTTHEAILHNLVSHWLIDKGIIQRRGAWGVSRTWRQVGRLRTGEGNERKNRHNCRFQHQHQQSWDVHKIEAGEQVTLTLPSHESVTGHWSFF